MLFLVPRLLHSRVYFLYNTSTAGNKHWSEKAPGTRGEYFLQGSKFDPSEVLKRKGSDFLHLTPWTMVYKPQPQTTNYRTAILYFVFIVKLCQCTLHFIRTSGKRANTCTAKKTMTKAWKAEGRRDARHTEAKMAALSEMALDTLKQWARENSSD